MLLRIWTCSRTEAGVLQHNTGGPSKENKTAQKGNLFCEIDGVVHWVRFVNGCQHIRVLVPGPARCIRGCGGGCNRWQ